MRVLDNDWLQRTSILETAMMLMLEVKKFTRHSTFDRERNTRRYICIIGKDTQSNYI